MFEKTVESATFPVILEMLGAVQHQLHGVRERLNDQVATADANGDRLGAIVAAQQLGVLNAWEPMVGGMIADLKAEVETHPAHRSHP